MCFAFFIHKPYIYINIMAFSLDYYKWTDEGKSRVLRYLDFKTQPEPVAKMQLLAFRLEYILFVRQNTFLRQQLLCHLKYILPLIGITNIYKLNSWPCSWQRPPQLNWQSIALDSRDRGFDSQPEGRKWHFSQLVPGGLENGFWRSEFSRGTRNTSSFPHKKFVKMTGALSKIVGGTLKLSEIDCFGIGFSKSHCCSVVEATIS